MGILIVILLKFMGGHSAWRKRVAAGEVAKGQGGAIARHRPHFGRKGEDLKLNRKGNIAGGNPKKAKSKAKDDTRATQDRSLSAELERTILAAGACILFASLLGAMYLFSKGFYSRQD